MEASGNGKGSRQGRKGEEGEGATNATTGFQDKVGVGWSGDPGKRRGEGGGGRPRVG